MPGCLVFGNLEKNVDGIGARDGHDAHGFRVVCLGEGSDVRFRLGLLVGRVVLAFVKYVFHVCIFLLLRHVFRFFLFRNALMPFPSSPFWKRGETSLERYGERQG